MSKIGFNNFKAFGAQMQYFSKKPITLIYGPNSIGKSSLLHSQLLLEKIVDTNYIQYILNFYGDELDIGNFDSFIHKHNSNKEITYEYIINDKQEILEYLFKNKTVNMLYKQNIFNHNLTLDEIEKKLEGNCEGSNIKFKSIIYNNYIMEKDFISESKKNQKLYFDGKINFTDFNKRKENLFEQLETKIEYENLIYTIESHWNVDLKNTDERACFFKNNEEIIDKYLEDISNLRNSLNKSDDYIGKIIYNFYDGNSTNTLETFNAIQYVIALVDEIKFVITLKNEKEVYTTLYINDELHIDEKGIINKKSNLFLQFSKISTIGAGGIKRIYNDPNLLFRYIKNNQKVQAQYFGPMRPYPKRKDMTIATKSIDIQEEHNLEELFFNRRDLKIMNLFKKYHLSSLLLLWPKLLKLIYQTGGFNTLLSEKNKKRQNNSLNSAQLWIKLITNKNIQEKISIWLENENKLQSTYKIKVEKSIINWIDTMQVGWQKTIKDKNNIFDIVFSTPFKIIENILIKLNKIKPLYLSELKFVDTKTNTEVTPRDMGLGISQILPILISTLDSKEKKIFLEQPELHLHPKIQMDIMDEFIRSAKENNNNFMIETHSEHMLLRIMKRMKFTAEDKEGRDKSLDLTPDDICLLYVDSNKDGAYIKELRLNKKGKLLDHWPNGFFEEGYKERFA